MRRSTRITLATSAMVVLGTTAGLSPAQADQPVCSGLACIDGHVQTEPLIGNEVSNGDLVSIDGHVHAEPLIGNEVSNGDVFKNTRHVL